MLHRYCDAADRRDWSRFGSVFDPASTHKHDKRFEGLSLDFVGIAEKLFSHLGATQHLIGNIMIEIDGCDASSQCSLISVHHVPGDAPLSLFPRHQAGQEEIFMVGARYFDNLRYADGKWLIVRREAVHDWEQWMPSEGRGFVRDEARAAFCADAAQGCR